MVLNTLMIRNLGVLEDIKTDYTYLELFPDGLLNAGADILNNTDKRAMANRVIFELGLYQERSELVFNDLYSNITIRDAKIKISEGKYSEVTDGLNEEEMHLLKSVLDDMSDGLSDGFLLQHEYIYKAMETVIKGAKNGVNLKLHSETMTAIVKLALISGYRIIMDDHDTCSLSEGLFRDIFLNHPDAEYLSTSAIVSGLSYIITLNDPQLYLEQSNPIIKAIKNEFPEAQSVSVKIMTNRGY